MKRIGISILTIAIVAALLIPAAAQQLTLEEFLANPHIWNLTGQECNDLEICFTGICPCCIQDFFIFWPGGALPPAEIIPTPTGVCVRWYNPDDPIPPDEAVHGGLSLTPDCPPPTSFQVTLTYDGKPIAEIPTPWQSWILGEDGEIIDVLRYTPGTRDREPLLIEWQYGVLPEKAPLDVMMPELMDSYLEEVGGEWRESRSLILYPNTDLHLPIRVSPKDRAAIVSFTAARPSDPRTILSHSFHQLVFEWSDPLD